MDRVGATASVRVRTAQWLAASRWRKRVELLLAPSGLTFTQWLVLGATRELPGATEAPVSQSDLSLHLEMHRSTVADALFVLAAKGLVDRRGAAEGPSWRILLTSSGWRLLADLDPEMDAVSVVE